MRLGYETSGLERTNPPPSKWLVAPGPLLASHCIPIQGRRHTLRAGCMDTGRREAYWT